MQNKDICRHSRSQIFLYLHPFSEKNLEDIFHKNKGVNQGIYGEKAYMGSKKQNFIQEKSKGNFQNYGERNSKDDTCTTNTSREQLVQILAEKLRLSGRKSPGKA